MYYDNFSYSPYASGHSFLSCEKMLKYSLKNDWIWSEF